ncbi:MAG: hypothetical protein ACI4IR_07185 [Eubacterium sp.]
MFVLFGTAAVIIITVLQLCIFKEKKPVGEYIHIFLKNEFIINLVSLELLTKVFKYKHIFVTDGYGMSSFIKYFCLALAVGVAFVLI